MFKSRSKSAERASGPSTLQGGPVMNGPTDMLTRLMGLEEREKSRNAKFEKLHADVQSFSVSATQNIGALKGELAETKSSVSEVLSLIGKQTSVLQKQESFISSEFKALGEALKTTGAERMSQLSDEGDDEEVPRPHNHIKSRTDYINAIKNSKALFPLDLKAGHVDSWAEQGFREIRKAYPSLEDHEVADVLAHRLPKGSVEFALAEVDDSYDLEKFKALAKLVGGVVEPRTNLGVENERLFHAQIPQIGAKLKSVRAFVAECVEMGVCLSVPSSRRKIMVIDKITCFLPLYFQDRIKENVAENPMIGVWDAVAPILAQNAVGEVERHLRNIRAPESYLSMQSRAVVAEAKVESHETRKMVCLRCGQEGHRPRYCPLHKYSADVCAYCKKVLNLDLFHLESECRNKKVD